MNVKRREIERKLKQLGWWLKGHGGDHDIWTNGEATESVPRHREVNEFTAKTILRNAAKGGRPKR